MNEKLDNLFKFRDNKKFKIFAKIYTYAVLVYILVCLGFICSLHPIDLMNFIAVPLLLFVSFFRKNDYLFLLAEFFTIIADMCMMLHLGGRTGRCVGFTFFFIVQTVYAIYFYIRDTNKKRRLIITIVRPCIMILAIFIDCFAVTNSFDYITVMGSIYLINLLINLVYAIIFKDPILIFSFGIFIVSDIFIATRQFVPKKSSYYIITDKLNHMPYLLSQVGLAFNKHNNDYFSRDKMKNIKK